MTVETAASGDSANNNTNTGIPGEYVVDMNDKLLELLHKGMWHQSTRILKFKVIKIPGNNYYVFLQKILHATARGHAIKHKSQDVSLPCQEFQYTESKQPEILNI